MKRAALFIVYIPLIFVAANDVKAVQPIVAVGKNPVTSCENLEDIFSYSSTTITDVIPAPEGSINVAGIGPMPEHCIVKGHMNKRTGFVDGKTYAIGFEMRLPVNWNGRFFYQANGGMDGSVRPAYGNILGGGPTSNGLLRGFAVISSDAGHTDDRSSPISGGEFGIDPQARLDYGYNAVAQLTPMAKHLIKSYYGKYPDYSYLVGTSNGGRHAMVTASRYADAYDGYLAGAPGFNLPRAAVAQLWGVQQYATISDYDDATGRPDVWTSFSEQDTALVSARILAKCDALDGVKDDMAGDPLACQELFNINDDVPTCEKGKDGPCLTYGQKSVLARVHAGARDSSGKALYAHFVWDPGILSDGWRAWKFVNATRNRDALSVGFIFTTPPQNPGVLNGTGTTLLDYALNWNGIGFDVNRDAPKIYATDGIYSESALSFMTPPDPLMKQLQETGGKLIVVHGSADPVFSVADTVNWYDSLSNHHKENTEDFARLFIVPGMGHSRGGPACDQFDLVDAIVKWVEQGIEPDAVIAKARGGNTELPASWSPERTRPLCAYPAVPMYNGDGDIEDASSFSCVIPKK
jgi:feruloyl esterase